MNEFKMEEIKTIVDGFPELPERERSMIEIIKFHNKENVNSNYLAYYFDENQNKTHGLGRLFLDALLQILEDKNTDFDGSIFDGNFTVTTEKGAKDENGKGRIDILIKGNRWAIIIENKIHSDVYNPLSTYIGSIEKEEKKGVLLTLWTLNKSYENLGFVNITHKELIDEVKKNLGQNITSVNPKTLLFLQDFILNVENYYYDEREDVKKAYQDRLMYFYENTEHKENITKDITNDINDNLKRILNYHHFTNNTTKETTWWLYYDKNNTFQIFYDTDWITKNKKISLRFAVGQNFFEKNKENQCFISEFKSDEFGQEIDKNLRRLYYQKIDFNEIPKDKCYIDLLNEIINDFINKKNEVKKNIIMSYSNIVSESLENLGFKCNGDGFEHKYFYNREDVKYQKFRFYINNEKLLENHLLFTFEFNSEVDRKEYDNLIKSGKINKNVNQKYLQLFLKNEPFKKENFEEEIKKCIKNIEDSIFPLISKIATQQ